MKRSVTLILLLALLAAGILTGSTLALDSKGDQVTITTHALAGDPSTAEGLTVNFPLIMGGCLFWDISFPADQPEQAATQFRYDPDAESPSDTDDQASVDFLLASTSYSDIYLLGGSLWEDVPPALTAMLKQLAAGMEPDTERTRTVRLTDYMDCWPLKAYLPDCPLPTSVLNQRMSEYFTVPIPQDYQVEVELATNRLGDLNHVVCRKEEHYLFQSDAWSFETPQGYLFTFPNTYYDGQLTKSVPIDSSRLLAGWGLYRLTLNSDNTDGQLETVYTLPEGSEILDFLADGDKSTFFLLTREEGMLRLRVFDERAALQNTFDLLPMGKEDHYMQTYAGADFLVPMLYGEGPDSYRLAVVAADSQGWQPDFTFSLAEQAALGVKGISWLDTYLCPLSMDYADGRLAIRDAYGDYGENNFYISVYTEDGLAYLGTYESSLTIPAVLQTEYDIATNKSTVCTLPPVVTTPLLSWSEAPS